MGKTIAVFSEPGAIGPVMNLVGICQGLRDMGHKAVFILEPGLAGTVESYGFEEKYISCMEPMSAEAQAKYWDDFMIKYMPSFRTSPLEQVPTYVKGCWEAIVDTSRWSVKNGLDKLIAEIEPDLIVNDNVALYPATQQAGCPWVRMVSCSENEITDPDIPPHLSGCNENDKAGFKAYTDAFETHVKGIHDGFMDFLETQGCERLPFPEFVLPSPYLNLMLYPKPLRFNRRTPLDPEKFVYLDGCVRKETEAYEVPTFKKHNDKPLIYFSYGSLGITDTDLIKRIIELIGKAPYRMLVNVGDYMDQYDTLPDNVILSSWYRQTAVLPHVDAFIQHGGNNSFNESLYFGIPPIVMPFVWDGHDNATRVNDTKHGIGMNRYEWTDEELLGNIVTVLNDAEMRANVKATSEYMQAQDGRMRAANAINDLLGSL
jgi:MGT family glycosyltransferase